MTFSELFDRLGDLGGSGWLAVVVATVTLFVLGFLWYGPIFGRSWAVSQGLEYGQSPTGMGKPIAITVVYYFVFNVGVAYLMEGDTLEHAVVWGIIVGVLLLGPALLAPVAWAKKPTTVFVIDLGHWFAAATVAFLVQGLF